MKNHGCVRVKCLALGCACSASLQGTRRTLLPYTLPLFQQNSWKHDANLGIGAQLCQVGTLLLFGRWDHKRLQSLAQLSFPLTMPRVPHLVPSPRQSPSPADRGVPKDLWSTTDHWGLDLLPGDAYTGDLQRPLLSTHERMERALRRETGTDQEFTWHTREF